MTNFERTKHMLNNVDPNEAIEFMMNSGALDSGATLEEFREWAGAEFDPDIEFILRA